MWVVKIGPLVWHGCLYCSESVCRECQDLRGTAPLVSYELSGVDVIDRSELTIVAIVPCHNEEAAIGKVVRDLRAAVPDMEVYVYDNRCTDLTALRAAEAGATVRYEPRKGKGNVVRRAFADIEADVYLLIDGDDTYDADAAPEMIATLLAGPYDHVLGVREQLDSAKSAYRPNHERGNRVLNALVGVGFGSNVGDMLSGYRAFSRRFVKSFPAVSREFELETELTVHSLALRLPAASVPVGFRDRAEGTESKLKTYRDGRKILKLIVELLRHERPLVFYGLFAAVTLLCSGGLVVPLVVDYWRTGLVPRFPTLLVAVALAVVGCIAITVGLVLDGIRKSRHELSRLTYLQIPPAARIVHDTYASESLALPSQRSRSREPRGPIPMSSAHDSDARYQPWQT